MLIILHLHLKSMKIFTAVLLFLSSAMACGPGYTSIVFDFETFTPGQYVTTLSDGTTTVSAFAKRGGYTAQGPRIYDSDSSGGEDEDLEAGVGNLLIVQESNKMEPDDNADGGFITFSFTTEPVVVESITLVDNNLASFMKCSNGGSQIYRVTTLTGGEASVVVTSTGRSELVDECTVRFRKSGGIASLNVCVPTSTTPEPTTAPTPAPTTPEPTPEPTTGMPTALPTLGTSAQNDQVTCISVIDENDNNYVDAQWDGFRTLFPDRAFCLLQPIPAYTVVSLPSSNFDPPLNVYSTTNRDADDSVDPADWYDLCDLAASKAKGITNVLLFIDNSGSMTTTSVSGAFALFQARAAAEGFTIVDTVYNSNEDYISPCEDTNLI